MPNGNTGNPYRFLRELMGLTSARMASLCGLSAVYWQQLESGRRDNPSGKAVAAVESACGVPAGTLDALASADLDKVRKELLRSVKGMALANPVRNERPAGTGMDRGQILDAIRAMAPHQGFYGRLLAELERLRAEDPAKYDGFMSKLESESPRDAVDLYLLLET